MKKEILSDEEIKFIETFVQKSSDHLLEKSKDVASICKVSRALVDKCFSNIRFISKLKIEMNKKSLKYLDTEYPDNFVLNLIYVDQILKKLKKIHNKR